MPTSADVVIIGGGILGTSLAYYLAQKGAGDVVLLERASIADGSTGKSAAIVRMHYTNPVTVQLALRSRDLFLNWGERVGGPGVYTQCGWYFLAPSHQEDNVRRNVTMQRAIGVDAEFVDAELLALCPEWEALDGQGEDRADTLPLAKLEALGQRLSFWVKWSAQLGERSSRLMF